MAIRKQDNFFEALNGEWLAKTDFPAGYPSWGSFEILGKKAIDDVKQLILDLEQNYSLISKEQQMIVNLYQNYLDNDSRNKDGINPIKPIIEKIEQLKNKKELTSLFINLFKEFGISFFHSKGVDSDFKDSNLRALMISSMSLGMSDRDFYDTNHPRHNDIKKAYQKYITDLKNESQLEFSSENLFDLIYNFEEQVSKVMLKQEELRNPEKIYNIVLANDLTNLADFIDWSNYLTEIGYIKANKIILTEPEFLKKLNELISNISIEQLKDIFKFKVLSSFSSILTINLYNINFEYGTVFSGLKENKPEQQRAIEFTNNRLGDIIGQEYIKKHFSQQAKDDVLKMVHDLIKVYSKRIDNLEWMSQTTKQKAKEKLNSLTIKIGYPDKFDDLSSLEINLYKDNGSLFENILSISKYWIEKELKEINLPVDKSKWYMYPQTVNAYYNPTSNEICFPAAILQKPFYDINQSHAKNLSGIGSVIGHEVSHGFDDEGSKFDKDGNLNDWWTENDYKEYRIRTKALEEQYNEYEINGSKVNGKLTLGENIGDLGGLSAALDICLEQSPNDLEDFFENYAEIWKRKSTDELKNTRLLIDPHSPEEFRCNGVLVNIDKFHEVYNTQPGDKMYKPKEQRIKIW